MQEVYGPNSSVLSLLRVGIRANDVRPVYYDLIRWSDKVRGQTKKRHPLYRSPRRRFRAPHERGAGEGMSCGSAACQCSSRPCSSTCSCHWRGGGSVGGCSTACEVLERGGLYACGDRGGELCASAKVRRILLEASAHAGRGALARSRWWATEREERQERSKKKESGGGGLRRSRDKRMQANRRHFTSEVRRCGVRPATAGARGWTVLLRG